jgi:hypothetical protein
LIYVAPQHNLFPPGFTRKVKGSTEMFFFLPFIAAPEPASASVLQRTVLPLLPASRTARAGQPAEAGLPGAISEAGNAAVSLLKRALASMASSMTALGNRANALFGQVAAALAFQRMARQTAELFGAFWPGFAQGTPRYGFAAPWMGLAPQPGLSGSFGLPGFDANLWPLNPLNAVNQALGMWAGFFAPAASHRR